MSLNFFPPKTYIILHGDLGRAELLVVGSAAGLVQQPAGDAANQQTVVDFELNHGVQL